MFIYRIEGYEESGEYFDELELLRLEENTWALLQAVMPLVTHFIDHCVHTNRKRPRTEQGR
jgi:hypothetical protein